MSEGSGGGAWREEVLRVYPHRVSITRAMWRSFFEDAAREISILTDDGRFLAHDAGLMQLLAEKAPAGVHVRIVVSDPAGWETLSEMDGVRLAVHRAVLGNAMYRADDELLVHQYIHGVSGPAAPVLHLRSGDLYRSYLEGFEHVWLEATCQQRSR